MKIKTKKQTPLRLKIHCKTYMGSYFEFGLKQSITFMHPNFSFNLYKNEASFHSYSFNPPPPTTHTKNSPLSSYT